ncbi:hypothetical protein PACTADRAFT_16143 [Pachysolen tannophilus NRRL Y-2460]|uniref:Major facilitator superfamily (MFS) profile domain-containing protein n=1 Tax=Pachysolen tannophilus NRRL Y-2460 TaxID=669874 RepID=A0A1E4TW25_PACTA|nr:hypothetical protein PACTADRAFT_16143 [Pachysolen tannophilus NRRL Y-2460]
MSLSGISNENYDDSTIDGNGKGSSTIVYEESSSSTTLNKAGSDDIEEEIRETSPSSTTKQEAVVKVKYLDHDVYLDTLNFRESNRLKVQILVVFSFFFYNGLIDQTIGTLVPSFLQYYEGLNNSSVSYLFLSPLLGYITTSLLNDYMHKLVGFQGTLRISALSSILCFALVSCKPPFYGLVVAYVFCGIGNGTQGSAVNTWVGKLKYHNEIMGVLHSCYGIGCMLSPLIITKLVDNGISWNVWYMVLTFLGVALLASTFTAFEYETSWKYLFLVRQSETKLSNGRESSTYEYDDDYDDDYDNEEDCGNDDGDEDAEGTSLSKSSFRTIIKNKDVLFFSTTIFFYVGGEVAFGNWLYNYLLKVEDTTGVKASYITSSYWFALTLGRFLLGLVIGKWFENNEYTVAMFLCALIAASAFLFAFVDTLAFKILTIALLGFFVGPMYPTSVIVAMKTIPSSVIVLAIGFIVGTSSTGASVLPYSIGWLSEMKSINKNGKGLKVFPWFTFAIYTISKSVVLALVEVAIIMAVKKLISSFKKKENQSADVGSIHSNNEDALSTNSNGSNSSSTKSSSKKSSSKAASYAQQQAAVAPQAQRFGGSSLPVTGSGASTGIGSSAGSTASVGFGAGSGTGSSSNPKDYYSDVQSSNFKSFQYSFNSNNNSLFSNNTRSRRTFRTASTDLSSNTSFYSGNKKPQAQPRAAISSIGQPLRVLNEQDALESNESTDEQESVGGSSSLKKKSSFIRSNDEDISALPASISTLSIQSQRIPSSSLSSPTSSSSAQMTTTQGNINTVDEASLNTIVEKVEKQLKILSVELNNIILQINQSILNFTKSSIMVGDLIQNTVNSLSSPNLKNGLKIIPFNHITTTNSPSLRKIVKIILYIIDNLLNQDVYNNSRALILKSFNELLIKLKLVNQNFSGTYNNNNNNINDIVNYNALLAPKLFSIGSTTRPFPNENKVQSIMNTLLEKFNGNSPNKDKSLLDQEGSFIAPVMRGFYNENISVISFIFGFPELTKDHKQIVNFFYGLIEDIHFMCQKNYIKLANDDGSKKSYSPMYNFKAPFRIPSNPNEPPISLSIACENSTNLSGTLGGYVFPKIPKSTINSKLLKYQNSIFGITCAHVVLAANSRSDHLEEEEYPSVSVPSPVLINLYKRALNNEKNKYHHKSEEHNAYASIVKQIDQIFPLAELKVILNSNNNSVQEEIIKRNLPRNKFGQIIWGERIVNNQSGKLSDLAVIKINDNENKIKCLNYLGDDINFNEYDPSLMFSNLYIKRTIDLSTLNKSSREGTNINGGGLEVFKYGSTTKYSRGALNGIKMVYWSDGKLQSSEFVVKSSNFDNLFPSSRHGADSGGGGAGSAAAQTNLGFASGGDSGAWILSKLEDVDKYENDNVNSSRRPQNQQYQQTQAKSPLDTIFEKVQTDLSISPASSSSSESRQQKQPPKTGLGVIGMLHSYDGEFKQFGLFTPITTILDRLEEVTSLSWGVVGCDEDLDDPANETLMSDNEDVDADLSDDEDRDAVLSRN